MWAGGSLFITIVQALDFLLELDECSVRLYRSTIEHYYTAG